MALHPHIGACRCISEWCILRIILVFAIGNLFAILGSERADKLATGAVKTSTVENEIKLSK